MKSLTVTVRVGLYPRDHAVLRLLAEKDPLNKYRILKYLPAKFGSRPTILESIQRLEKDHLIRVHHIQTHARGMEGVSKYYDLTLLGLVWVIGALTMDRDRRLLDKLAVKYQHLEQDGMRFSIFDLWPNIKAAGIQDKVASALVSDCSNNPSLSSLRTIDDRALLLPVFKMDPKMDPAHWYPLKETRSGPMTTRYLSAVGRDKALRAKFVELLNRASNTHQHYAEVWLAYKALIDRMRAEIEMMPDLPR